MAWLLQLGQRIFGKIAQEDTPLPSVQSQLVAPLSPRRPDNPEYETDTDHPKPGIREQMRVI